MTRYKTPRYIPIHVLVPYLKADPPTLGACSLTSKHNAPLIDDALEPAVTELNRLLGQAVREKSHIQVCNINDYKAFKLNVITRIMCERGPRVVDLFQPYAKSLLTDRAYKRTANHTLICEVLYALTEFTYGGYARSSQRKHKRDKALVTIHLAAIYNYLQYATYLIKHRRYSLPCIDPKMRTTWAMRGAQYSRIGYDALDDVTALRVMKANKQMYNLVKLMQKRQL